MAEVRDWWRVWAPYLRHIEDRHLRPLVTGGFVDGVTSPALVVGAGQGLIVEYLRGQGFTVDGLERDPRMIALARERRGLELDEGDAKEMPFADGAYQTVIISSGVVDYLDDDQTIRAILAESHRVLAPGGSLFVAFYKLPSPTEAVYRRVGVIVGQRYYMRRIFQIHHWKADSVFRPVGPIARWTGRSLLAAAVHWFHLGATLPDEIKRDRRRIEQALAQAEADGVSWDALYDSVPESVPYRSPHAVRALLRALGEARVELDEYEDCTVARLGAGS